MEITYFGHSCFLIAADGLNILFDPFISGNPLAGHVKTSEIKADYILLSHGHGDHIADTEQLARQNDATVVGQPEVTNWFKKKGLEKLLEMNIGGRLDLGAAQVKMVKAIHSSSLPDGTYGGTAAGYVVQLGGKTIYFAGDTALTYDMKIIGEQFTIDAALLPIGDNYTMGIEDALLAAEWVKAKHFIPMHYDTFPVIKTDRKTVSETAQKVHKELTFIEIGQTITI